MKINFLDIDGVLITLCSIANKDIEQKADRRVLDRIEHKAQENRVLLVRVDPANTSRTCPNCGAVHKDNRKGENFCCGKCGHALDADTVGARNVLARTLETLGSVESPRL